MQTAAVWTLSFFLAALGRASADETPAPPAEAPDQKPATEAPAPAKDDEPIEEVADVKDLSNDTSWNQEMFPVIDRVVNLLTAHTVRKLSLLIVVDHRANQTFTSDAFKDWFGLDAGSLKIGLGLRFGILDDLDVGVMRLNGTVEIFDTYQFDARYQLLKQDRHFLNLALRAGLTWFYQPSGYDQVLGFLGQLLLDRTFFDRLNAGAGLLYHSNSSGGRKSNLDPDGSLAVAAWLEYRPISVLALDLEASTAVWGYSEAHPAFSAALKFITNRHTFSLVFTTTQYITADGIVANTFRTIQDTIIGFTITREINF